MRSVDRYLSSGESVLIPRKGSLNNVMYVNKEFWTVDTMFFTVPRKRGAAKYAYQHLKTLDLASMNSGSAVPSMTTDILNGLQLPIPNDEGLAKFDETLQPAYSLIQQSKSENTYLGMLRDALLPKLMSGEVDVSKIDITQLNNHLLDSIDTLFFSRERGKMDKEARDQVLLRMQHFLNGAQLRRLAKVLNDVVSKEDSVKTDVNYLEVFLKSKEVEGCSIKTLSYYRATIEHMNKQLRKEPTAITTDDLRHYLRDYELKRHSSKVTIDNIRRILSSYFSWLEDEDYIVKSPVRRIRHVRVPQTVKETFTEEQLEIMRSVCDRHRDLAIVDLLASTGMRIGELVGLDIDDVDFIERECIVTGKGNKQRPVYFDVRTKLHLLKYLETRSDTNPALFVSLDSNSTRLSIGAIELRLRRLGRKASVGRVYPHKFRRTLATHAIDKGMPIEQVQKMLGHARIDTTMHYAMVNQSNVKASHRRYLE